MNTTPPNKYPQRKPSDDEMPEFIENSNHEEFIFEAESKFEDRLNNHYDLQNENHFEQIAVDKS